LFGETAYESIFVRFFPGEFTKRVGKKLNEKSTLVKTG
jgi:hypothetical protein